MSEQAATPGNSALEAPAAPAPADSVPASVEVPEGVDPRTILSNPLLAEPAPTDGTGEQPVADPGTHETPPEDGDRPDYLVGNFKTAEEQARAYKDAQDKITIQGAELGELRRQNQEHNALLEQIRAGQHPLGATPPEQPEAETPAAEPAPQVSVQELIKKHFADMSDEDNQKFQEDLYENPGQAFADKFGGLLEELTQGIEQSVMSKMEQVNQAVEPLIAERQQSELNDVFVEALDGFRDEHADFNTFLPQIEETMAEYKEIIDVLPPQISIPLTYGLAKGKAYESLEARPTLDQLLEDPDAQEKFASLDAVKTKVLTDHATQIREGAPPTVISGQPAGTPAAMPPVEIKSAKDASRAARGFFEKLRIG